ncbi:MAG TPA: aminoglycoside phosphotransferase family protein [Nocardioidaceae bacterium]|nr:aminoglycoside phosphotransferase family protein [Nocardioidaceae bacterium]
MDAPEPAAVLAAFRIPGPAVDMSEVSGAWSNRVFRLTTARSRYAVKQILNPWGDAGWQAWLDVAWQFERRAYEAGVEMPQPIPNPADGSCLAWVEASNGRPVPVRLHRWVDGAALGSEPVDRATAQWAGRVLAVLHGLQFQPAERSVFPALHTGTADTWPDLIRASVDARSPWAGLLVEAEPAVGVIADLVRDAELPEGPDPMSHADFDQKNIVRSPRGPVLCDWDVAAPVVPRQELAEAAMSMASWKRVHIARIVVASYEAIAGRRVKVEPADLGPAMMRSLDWIRFNVERAIGTRPASPHERAASSSLVPSLLQQLPNQAYVAQRVADLLGAA